VAVGALFKQISNLDLLFNKIGQNLPSLHYLSLLGNAACPNQPSDPDKDEEDYQRYRYWLLLLDLVCYKFDVRKSVHYHTIQINQPTRCNSFTSLLLDVYVWLSMFRAPLHPSSGAYNCTKGPRFLPLGSGGWSVVGRGLAGHDQQRSNGKTRGS
jgi:hypothetical protein